MIDEQIAFLYARRLGYAAVAGLAKYKQGTPLNDPTRNQAIAEGMAERVRKYGGGDGEAGRVMGGEGCQIFASLEFEKEQIRETCDSDFNEKIQRVCE
jgi:chorismate mutase